MNPKIDTVAGMKIVRLLGKGGMSEVYEVENPRLGSRHALKLYSYPNDCSDVQGRFEVEGKLLAKLNHPRIVKVVDTGVDGGTGKPYFVMDLVCSPDGCVKSLADIQAGEADESEIGRWYDDIREGLAYIHGKGVVHRDLKLQNILIGPDGHAVITDFGISRIFTPDDGGDTIVDPVQTIVRMQGGKKPVMGSLGYMAPELEMGAAATDKSDWYALGVIVFRLLTGTWCDSRTNVADMLSSYDPVWMRILPLLLHSNPEGRKCLSYSEERTKLDELKLIAFEDKVESTERRMRMFGWATASAVAAAIALGVVLGVQLGKLRGDRDRLTKELCDMRNRASIPDFNSMFSIPKSATDEETELSPSREQFELAFFDALALTRSIFADLKAGSISRDKAKSMIQDLSIRARDDDMDLFSALPEGFTSSGEMRALAVLLEKAAKGF
ncbi:MAG: serine/threonine protein kinase [Kiritimatiellae bacterium]|nr:serine/threonine protein kinase [Kiritimatiellia bacterium]